MKRIQHLRAPRLAFPQGLRLGTLRINFGIMPTHVHQGINGGHFFCTFTCWEWLPLIERTQLYDHLYAWMHLITGKGCRITGFVLMPNHVHLLLFVPEGLSINSILANLKRFAAYEIIARLQRQEAADLLSRLVDGLTSGDKAREQQHRVWRTSSDIKVCTSDRFVTQKLDYIHANPVKGKWSLVADASDYAHSSAAFYLNGSPGPAPVVHYHEVT